MLTSVQKEILQTLINLYQSSNGKSIKGEDIAEVMARNPGTIRNQMQSLRSLGLVKGKVSYSSYNYSFVLNEKKDGKITVDFNLNADEWEAEVQKAYERNKGKYKLDGFRQGKIPRKVLEKKTPITVSIAPPTSAVGIAV